MSFEEDLLGDTGSVDSRLIRLQEALLKIGVLKNAESLLAFHEIQPWHRSGGETYLASAEADILLADGAIQVRQFVAKAIVSWNPDLIQRAQQLANRYLVLSSSGVRVPVLYAIVDGVIYQEFIPFKVTQSLILSKPVYFEEYCSIAAILDNLGFQPLSFTDDLMASSEHLYYIDVGYDLGNFSPKKSNKAKMQMLKHLPEEYWDRAVKKYENTFIKIEQSGVTRE